MQERAREGAQERTERGRVCVVVRRGEEEIRDAHQEFLTIQDVAVIPTMVTAWLGAVL